VFYQRSLVIERRLERVMNLIQFGRQSTQSLAETLEVSVPTVSRCIAALRERGYSIEPHRSADGWFYVLGEISPVASIVHPNHSVSQGAPHV
jgi:biotin operon repressor